MQRFFARTVEIAKRADLSPERVIFDPGAGFGKTQAQNLELVARLAEMRSWGHPVLLGTSRKSMIGNVLNLPVDQRLEGTLATTALAAWAGVELIRVHDVAANVRVAKMVAAIRATLSP
jgi:dihydropteroate synthase